METMTGAVRIDTDKIPRWEADNLAECLFKSVRDYFSIQANRAKLETWKANRNDGKEEASS